MAKGSSAGKEAWGSKIGVILAVAGSAVGLGNFLRFPGQAAANGGGAFMIPYFIALLLLGIPICWAEWTMGRYGGRFGFNSCPGIFSAVARNRWSKYLGSLGLLIPVVIYTYYVYIESWCLAYAYHYATGGLELGRSPSAYSDFFVRLTGINSDGAVFAAGLGGILLFFVVTYLVNFFFIYRGLSGGIERLCKVAMPVLVLAAIVIVGRVLTMPEQPLPKPWQIGLEKVVPPDRWQALLRVIQGPDATPEAARAAVDAAIRDYFDALREGKEGYDLDVPVVPPVGFAATPAGVAAAMAELRAGPEGAQYREWIDKTRDGLSRDQQLALQTLEARELSLKSPTPEQLFSLAEEREAILSTSPAGPMPSLAATIEAIRDSETLGPARRIELRSAALEAAQSPRTVWNALGYMWNPDFSKLGDPAVWLAAAGQIFFSLSVGFGVVINYASYLRKNDDVVLSGLTASATNEFCEVLLGGLIAIPSTFLFLGTAMTLEVINSGSTFGLGFSTLPTVFATMPGGRWFGVLWFTLLFLAAITSSLSMLQPAIAFLEEGFRLRRRASVTLLAMLTASGSLAVLYFSANLTVLSTLDEWVGTVAINLLALVEILFFGWVIGAERGIEDANRGADLRIPAFFAPIFRFVTPAFLLTILAAWIYKTMPLKLKEIQENPVVLATVIGILAFLGFLLLMIGLAGEQWRREGKLPSEEAA